MHSAVRSVDGAGVVGPFVGWLLDGDIVGVTVVGVTDGLLVGPFVGVLLGL